MIAANDHEVQATEGRKRAASLTTRLLGSTNTEPLWYASTNSHDSWGGGNGHPYLRWLLLIFKLQSSESRAATRPLDYLRF